MKDVSTKRCTVLLGTMLVFSWLLSACGGGVLLQTPPPIAAAPSPDQTEQAILDALPQRGWTAEDMKPGEIVAFLAIREHWLRVSIRYDNSKIVIFYLDSDQLGYEERDGQQYIHGAWVKWTRNLSSDIQRAVAKRSTEASTVAAAPSAGGQYPAGPAAADPAVSGSVEAQPVAVEPAPVQPAATAATP